MKLQSLLESIKEGEERDIIRDEVVSILSDKAQDAINGGKYDTVESLEDAIYDSLSSLDLDDLGLENEVVGGQPLKDFVQGPVLQVLDSYKVIEDVIAQLDLSGLDESIVEQLLSPVNEQRYKDGVEMIDCDECGGDGIDYDTLYQGSDYDEPGTETDCHVCGGEGVVPKDDMDEAYNNWFAENFNEEDDNLLQYEKPDDIKNAINDITKNGLPVSAKFLNWCKENDCNFSKNFMDNPRELRKAAMAKIKFERETGYSTGGAFLNQRPPKQQELPFKPRDPEQLDLPFEESMTRLRELAGIYVSKK